MSSASHEIVLDKSTGVKQDEGNEDMGHILLCAPKHTALSFQKIHDGHTQSFHTQHTLLSQGFRKRRTKLS